MTRKQQITLSEYVGCNALDYQNVIVITDDSGPRREIRHAYPSPFKICEHWFVRLSEPVSRGAPPHNEVHDQVIGITHSERNLVRATYAAAMFYANQESERVIDKTPQHLRAQSPPSCTPASQPGLTSFPLVSELRLREAEHLEQLQSSRTPVPQPEPRPKPRVFPHIDPTSPGYNPHKKGGDNPNPHEKY